MKHKQLLLSVFVLILSATAWANVEINEENFPDENFRNWILSQDYGTDEVLTDEEIANITSIYLWFMSIQSLQGIEYFTALTELDCGDNQLAALDVSKNTKLETLNCYGNQLTALDVSKNTALTKLECNYNQLTALDVSGCTALTTLACNNNQLTALDMSKNTALINLSCENNPLTALDVSKNTALIYLSCHNNQLTALDVSQNTALADLYCYNNQLTALDVSGCTALKRLDCYNNQLTALDVSGCTALTTLLCNNNQLTALDVSGCTALKRLDCYENQLKGAGMNALVESLPTRPAKTGYLYVIWNENDGNAMTTTQVAAAKAKGWMPLYYHEKFLIDYEGSDPNSISPTLCSVNNSVYYDLSGHRVKKVKKGVYVIGDKKVAVK